MNIILDLTPIEPIQAEIEKICGPIVSAEITDQLGYQMATDTLRAIKGTLGELETTRKSITKPLDDAKSTVMGIFKEPKEKLERADQVIRQAMGKFIQAQEVKRLEAQRAAEEAARIEEDKRKRELADAAQKDLDEGRTVAAMMKVEQADRVMVIAEPVKEAFKPQGTTMRANWKHRVIDPKLVPPEYLIPDDKLLASIAKSRKEKAAVPGVEFYNEKTLSLRGE